MQLVIYLFLVKCQIQTWRQHKVNIFYSVDSNNQGKIAGSSIKVGMELHKRHTYNPRIIFFYVNNYKTWYQCENLKLRRTTFTQWKLYTK
jgi:hypothetical protein